jgi:hypothetical protein
MSKINIITYNIGMGVEDNEGERKSNGPEKSALCGAFCFPTTFEVAKSTKS